MVILGLDPGTATTGYGVIRASSKAAIPDVLDFGIISTSSKSEMPERLLKIHKDITKLIEKYKPDVISIEEIFFNTNDKTAVSVSEARGVLLLTARLQNIQIFEYTPLQVKSAIVGYGRAEKRQVQIMVEKILFTPSTRFARSGRFADDAYDALGLALTHLYSYNENRR